MGWLDRFVLGGGELPGEARAAVTAGPAGGAGDERAVHAAIAEALITGVPTDVDGVADWRDAGPYLRANLAVFRLGREIPT